MEAWSPEEVGKLLVEYPDFPKPGILFCDVLPIFRNPQAVRALVHHIVTFVKTQDVPVDVVAGVEARGFLFGTLVADALNIGFVPVRKPNKLPGRTHRYSYDNEYRQDTLEMQEGSIRSGQRVLLVDDLLATGGTAGAAAILIGQLGGHVTGFACLVELEALGGRGKLPPTAAFYALVRR